MGGECMDDCGVFVDCWGYGGVWDFGWCVMGSDGGLFVDVEVIFVVDSVLDDVVKLVKECSVF